MNCIVRLIIRIIRMLSKRLIRHTHLSKNKVSKSYFNSDKYKEERLQQEAL